MQMQVAAQKDRMGHQRELDRLQRRINELQDAALEREAENRRVRILGESCKVWAESRKVGGGSRRDVKGRGGEGGRQAGWAGWYWAGGG
jgi:hypothetical protein